MKRSTLLLAVCLLGLAGCFQPGGGGARHTTPATFEPGEPVELELRLSVWGAGGKAEGRFKDVSCFYRWNGGEFEAIAMDPAEVVDEAVTFRVELPPPGDDVELLEYYFVFRFDGRTSTRGSPQEPLRIERMAAASQQE